MFIDNITISADSDIGYHVFINYSDMNSNYCEYFWYCRGNLDKMFEKINKKIDEIKIMEVKNE